MGIYYAPKLYLSATLISHKTEMTSNFGQSKGTRWKVRIHWQ